MGLLHSIPTREEFNARIAEISAKYPFLANEGCEIHYVMPGWLQSIEKCLDKLDKLSKGKVNFFVAEKNASGSMCNAFFEVDLQEKSGRYKAIEKTVEQLQIDIGSVCKFCGATIEVDPLFASCASSCKSHDMIVSGIFEGEIKYEEVQPDGIYCQPDAGEIAVEALHLMFDLQYNLADSMKVQDAVENLVTFLQTTNTQAQCKKKVPVPTFKAQKDEVFEKLTKAIKEKTEPEPDLPKIINTTGRVHPTMQLYKAQDLEEMWAKSQVRDRKSLMEPYYKRAKALGTARHFALVSVTWREELDALDAMFPHFSEVIDFLRQQFALAMCGDGRFHFPPILLNGVPGIGKSYLCQTIAEMLGTSFVTIDMAKAQNGADLAGASSYWSTAGVGKVASVLLMHETANPIVVIEELDKAAARTDHNPTAALLGLLEPVSANRFEDLCLGFEIDTSAVCWVFNSNEKNNIPDTILSRLTVFDVLAPTREQTINIAHQVYAKLLQRHWGKAFDAELPTEVAESLGTRAPREIGKTLLSALGKAAIDERTTINVDDLDDSIEAGNCGSSKYQDNKIGFAAEK